MMNWSILAHIGNRPTIEAAFGMQRISNLLTQVKRALTNSCPEPKGRTHEGLGIFYSAKGFYAPLYKKLLVPVKFLHSLVKQHAIHKMQCTFTFQAGQQISSQCNLTCRLFAQYWKKKSIASCLCVFCFIVFLVGWREGVGFFCCCYCKMSARDLFFVIAHFDSAFSLLLVWGRCSCYSFSLSSSFWFFFSFRTFPFVNWLPSLFALLLSCVHLHVAASKNWRCFCRCVCRSVRDSCFALEELWNALVFTFSVVSLAWLFLTVNDIHCIIEMV